MLSQTVILIEWLEKIYLKNIDPYFFLIRNFGEIWGGFVSGS